MILGSTYVNGTSVPTNTSVLVYTVPVGKIASLNLNVCQQGATTAEVSIAVTGGGTPSSADWIEYHVVLGQSDVLERTGIVLAAGEAVYIMSSATGVSAVALGIEEDA